MAFRRKPPVERLDDDSWIVRLQADEREVLSHIMNQLDELVENAQTGSESACRQVVSACIYPSRCSTRATR